MRCILKKNKGTLRNGLQIKTMTPLSFGDRNISRRKFNCVKNNYKTAKDVMRRIYLPRACSQETGSNKSVQTFVIYSMQENTTTNDVTTHTCIEEITKGRKLLLLPVS